MITIHKTDDKCTVYQNERKIGGLTLYNNPHHIKNCYVKLDMDCLDTDISAELFDKLIQIVHRPLQVMTSSANTSLTRFLTAGGFLCRRKCYEIEAGAKDYIGGNTHMRPEYCTPGEPDYRQSCRIMFDYYVCTHEAINPWTADYSSFCKNMPCEVVYAKQHGNIAALAFVEDNEISYVCGTDRHFFTEFAKCLAATMLAKHETLCFESDDCDWAAMTLKSLFINQDEISFDTYVLER